MIKQRKIGAIALLFCILLSAFTAFAQTERGVGNIKVKKSNGKTEEIKLYDASYALVIGNGGYTNGWDNLPGVKSDVAAVKGTLERQGFAVETAENLTSRDFSSRIQQFIDDYGYVENNRLLIYYAGHGHTLKSTGDGRDLGYVVPIDAPNPAKDEIGFKRKAIPMDDIQNFAKKIQAKHALFLFDSCFSGRLVTRNSIFVPPIIQESVAYPVRQFITAGAANQPVPDESIFRRSFVRALEGEADRNNDGYITGTELAEYLKEKVTNYSNRRQTPQYGKINDIELDRGDFVFVINKNISESNQPEIAIDKIRPEEVGRDAWLNIQNSTNPQTFREFIKLYPKGIYGEMAKIRLEQLIWEGIKTSRDKDKLQAYLDEFPNGAYVSQVRLKLISAVNESKNCANASEAHLNLAPKLYILAVGVSKYTDPTYNLGFPAKDAGDFVSIIQKQKCLLYKDIEVKLLTDEDAKRDDIVDGLDWLAKQTTSRDVAMVFFNGRGMNDNLNRYYFLPHNFNADRLASTGVTFSDIRSTVESIAGKVILFVDSNHGQSSVSNMKRRDDAVNNDRAANKPFSVDIVGAINELSSAENGATVFSASTGKRFSLESADWGNGAFTKALVEGLSGKAATSAGKITINSLDLYISERVKQLTNGQQTTNTAKPATLPDFPIAVSSQ